MVREFFDTNFSPPDIEKCSFYEKLHIYQAYMWYNYIIQDFLTCYRYSRKWVDLFTDNPEMTNIQTDIYLKGIHNLLSSLFMIRHYSRFSEVLEMLCNFEQQNAGKLDENNTLLLYMFIYVNRLNKHILEGTFTRGLEIIPQIEQFIETNRLKLDNHRILIFYYKMACLYFGHGDYKSAIRYLNEIINYKDVNLREDIHCFARILNLISHYELQNDELVEYQVRSTYRFLVKMEDMQTVQQHIFRFLRNLSYIQPENLHREFKKLHQKLIKLKDDPYEKRPFLYLDIISWLESKMENRPVQEIIHKKAVAEFGELAKEAGT